jgi:phosphatidate cytidylyltransferase
MLRWRLLLGTLIIAVLVGLGWLDHAASIKGALLLPVAVCLILLGGGEILALARTAGMQPVAWTVHGGNLLLLAAAWLPLAFGDLAQSPGGIAPSTWPMVALAVGTLLVFAAEMYRYEKPGGTLGALAAAIFALVYVGLMFALVIQVRMLWGIGALASLVIPVKMGDTGAYTVGRLFGRHPMTPRISPKKTLEGAAGHLLFAALASWATFAWLIPLTVPASTAASSHGQPEAWGRWIVFGLLVGAAGMAGDLAESLIKRDVGRKDSSTWLPGFGGVLDLLDSILIAAPVAWLCWACGLVGT